MQSQLDYLRRRFNFEAWREKGTSTGRLSLREIPPDSYEIAGWRAESVRQVKAEGWPPHLTSVWKPAQSGTDALLSVDVFECDSLAAAHEFLLRTLGEFQSPEIALQELNPPGDLAFVVPGDAAIVFAYANLVILIRNAGRELVPVTEISRQFHQSFAIRLRQK